MNWYRYFSFRFFVFCYSFSLIIWYVSELAWFHRIILSFARPLLSTEYSLNWRVLNFICYCALYRCLCGARVYTCNGLAVAMANCSPIVIPIRMVNVHNALCVRMSVHSSILPSGCALLSCIFYGCYWFYTRPKLKHRIRSFVFFLF